MTINDAKDIVSKKYRNNPKRLLHIMGVYEMASKLARRYNENEYEVAIAALFHDYTKFDSIDEQKKYLSKEIIEKYQNTTVMYHALSAAKVLEIEFAIENKNILSAIEKHVWGSENMNLIDKIVLISDKVEIGRSYQGVNRLRELALNNIDLAIYEFLIDSVSYELSMNRSIHPEEYKVINKFKELIDAKNK